MYHNRGDSTFAGESSTYGDFIGLDNLFTERPEVVDGMSEIYKQWVEFGIDGFRIDTVKHVNLEFWQKFVPDILGKAEEVGNDDFFAFGEVFDGNPAVMSEYTTAGKPRRPSTSASSSRGSTSPRATPRTSSATSSPRTTGTPTPTATRIGRTFLGNHDMGRASMFLDSGGRTRRSTSAKSSSPSH